MLDYLLLDITTSSKYSLDALEELVLGFFTACKTYNCKAKVSDVTTSAVGISFNATAINTQLPVQSPFVEGKINTGDLVCVTGDLGGAYLGLMLLEREKRVFKENPEMQPDLEGKDYIVGRQLKPHLRKDVVEHIKSEGIKLNASFGLENGLAKGILPYFSESELGAVLHEDKLPVDTETMMQAIDFGIDPTVAALDGGEDYEMGFIIPQSEYEKLQKLSQYITVIGYVADQTSEVLMQLKSGRTVPVKELKFTD
jgi:thiamine-monophosphate kinase